MKTRLTQRELWPDKLPQSFINRANETIAYLETQNLIGDIADCGVYNPMVQQIKNHFNKEITSIVWDFNWKSGNRPKKGIIFCFEILEHLYNPLLFLVELRKMLRPNGVIYLSTPRQWPQCLKAIHHYHEIPTDRLMWLFTEAGFEVVEMKKITIAGNWYNHIYGIRPLLRYFQKTRLFKLKIK